MVATSMDLSELFTCCLEGFKNTSYVKEGQGISAMGKGKDSTRGIKARPGFRGKKRWLSQLHRKFYYRHVCYQYRQNSSNRRNSNSCGQEATKPLNWRTTGISLTGICATGIAKVLNCSANHDDWSFSLNGKKWYQLSFSLSLLLYEIKNF